MDNDLKAIQRKEWGSVALQIIVFCWGFILLIKNTFIIESIYNSVPLVAYLIMIFCSLTGLLIVVKGCTDTKLTKLFLAASVELLLVGFLFAYVISIN